MTLRALCGGLAIIGVILCGGCLSPDFMLTTEGKFNGTYVSIEGAYSGPLFFDFTQEDEAIEVDGEITINQEIIDFTGSGTLTKDPSELDLNVTGTDFTMHIWGKITSGHLQGSYTFTSSKWGNHSGSVDLDQL